MHVGTRCAKDDARRAVPAHADSSHAVAYVDFAVQLSTPFWARRHAQAVLGAWDISEDIIEIAVLLVSELVTNACSATGNSTSDSVSTAPIRQTLRCQPDRIVIEVSDPDPRPPVIAHGHLEAESGRGLILVQALSKKWAFFYPPVGGKTVYCILHRHQTERNTP